MSGNTSFTCMISQKSCIWAVVLSSVQFAKPYEGNQLWKHTITANETNITKQNEKAASSVQCTQVTVKNWWGQLHPSHRYYGQWNESFWQNIRRGQTIHPLLKRLTFHCDSSWLITTVNKTCAPHTIPAFIISVRCQTAKNVNHVHNNFVLKAPVQEVCTVEHFEMTSNLQTQVRLSLHQQSDVTSQINGLESIHIPKRHSKDSFFDIQRSASEEAKNLVLTKLNN